MNLLHLSIQGGAHNHRVRTVVAGLHESLRSFYGVLEGVACFLPVAACQDVAALDNHQSFVAHFGVAVEDQVVLGIRTERGCSRRRSDIKRSVSLPRRLDVAPVKYEVFVDQRYYAALASDGPDGVGFLFADQPNTS